MTGNGRSILAVGLLALAGMSCQLLSGGGAAQLPFGDDFSTVRWGTATDENSSVEYVDNTLHMTISTRNYFVSSGPNDESYQNIHAEVTVLNNDTDSTTAFGIICHRQAQSENFYYVAMTPAGQYAIAKASKGQSDVFLTNEDLWAPSDLIPQEAASYRVGADCGNSTIILYVDGQEIASVSDTSYTRGGVAVFAWSGEEAASADVSFDDFLITALP